MGNGSFFVSKTSQRGGTAPISCSLPRFQTQGVCPISPVFFGLLVEADSPIAKPPPFLSLECLWFAACTVVVFPHIPYGFLEHSTLSVVFFSRF